CRPEYRWRGLLTRNHRAASATAWTSRAVLRCTRWASPTPERRMTRSEVRWLLCGAMVLAVGTRSAWAGGLGERNSTLALVKVRFADVPESQRTKILKAIELALTSLRVQMKSETLVRMVQKQSPELFSDQCLADDRCWTQTARALMADLTLSGSVSRTQEIS